MPTYDYRCRECGAEHEIVQRISDPVTTTCPTCGRETLERLVSRSSFALKGSGWYSDGYGAEKEKEAAKPDAPAENKDKKDDAAPAKAEPAKAEPAKTEPAKVDPVKTPPAKPAGDKKSD